MNVPQQILQHEASHPRTRVDNGQDEQGFEHDGEVIPEADKRFAAARSGENVGHA